MIEKAPGDRRIWVALGTPHPDYEATYHNVGRLALAYFMPETARFKTEPGGRFEFAKSKERIYVRPLTYMNESGPAVAAALKYFKLKPADILIFQDDSDLGLGSFKISCGSGAAGHHGVESLIRSFKTKEFCRVRIGIRPADPAPELRRAKAGEFVLKKISAADKAKLQSVFRDTERVIVKEEP